MLREADTLMARVARELMNDDRADSDAFQQLDERVMRAIRVNAQAPARNEPSAHVPGPWRRFVDTWSSGGGRNVLLAAGIVIAAALGLSRFAARDVQDVVFTLRAPLARRVAVVGDFNGWDRAHPEFQATTDGRGEWTLRAPVRLGHHRYSFVVDDSLWVADPRAPRVSDPDFGVPNSALVVARRSR